MFFLGLDFGTSGARAIAINRQLEIQFQDQVSYQLEDINSWRTALEQLLSAIPTQMVGQIKRIAIAATSSTVLISDRDGNPISPVLKYSDHRAEEYVYKIAQIAPPGNITISATSSLAKMLWLTSQIEDSSQPRFFLHQADYLGFLLNGKIGISDYHNALKLGYDPINLNYPAWLTDFLMRSQLSINLPQVFSPGEVIGKLNIEICDRFQFASDCQICAGTTDSNAAFLATVDTPDLGIAVTSLGSSLVLKLVSDRPIMAAEYGVYSHRLDWQNQRRWLVSGASNTGGAVLRHFFSDAQIAEYSAQINPNTASGLDYYPLLQPGDRFPINDPHLVPRMQPRPQSDIIFLHGLLEGIAKIEALGYQLLQQLGASQILRLYTNGGGAQNQIWTQIRQLQLKLKPDLAVQTEAAYGAAKLAASTMR